MKMKLASLLALALSGCTLLWPVGRPPDSDFTLQETFPDDGYGEVFVPQIDAGPQDAEVSSDAATDDAAIPDASIEDSSVEAGPCGDWPELGTFCEGPAGQCAAGVWTCVSTSIYCWCDDEYPRCDCPPWR
jgi:hypothetical protein